MTGYLPGSHGVGGQYLKYEKHNMNPKKGKVVNVISDKESIEIVLLSYTNTQVFMMIKATVS